MGAMMDSMANTHVERHRSGKNVGKISKARTHYIRPGSDYDADEDSPYTRPSDEEDQAGDYSID